MSYREAWMACALLIALAAACRADIFRWDNGQVIPGTEGITPSPGVHLSNRDLEYADFTPYPDSSTSWTFDLSGARFDSSNLSNADFYFANLTGANFRGADLASAHFDFALLASADLTGAVIAEADFGSTTVGGFTKEHLYSTASYKAKDLHRIDLGTAQTRTGFYPGPVNDLTGWDFSEQNLVGASFAFATLTNANLTDALVEAADFEGATYHGFTKEQLYATASYRAKQLQSIGLSYNDLAGWDLNGQNLRGANFYASKLTGVDFSSAEVVGAIFDNHASNGITREQLYETNSYKAKDLREISIGFYDLSGWNFNGQNLSGALLHLANLTNASFRGANLINATFESAGFANTDFTAADLRGAYPASLAGTARNAILPNGIIKGLVLIAGEKMLVRDDDALIDPTPRGQASRRPPIPVTIQNRLRMSEGSTLQLEFDADPWDSLISFGISTSVEIGGALELTFAKGVDVASQRGRTLRIFNWSNVSRTGQFQVRSPYVWDVSYLYATGEVTLLALPEPSEALVLFLSSLMVAPLTGRGRFSRIGRICISDVVRDFIAIGRQGGRMNAALTSVVTQTSVA